MRELNQSRAAATLDEFTTMNDLGAPTAKPFGTYSDAADKSVLSLRFARLLIDGGRFASGETPTNQEQMQMKIQIANLKDIEDTLEAISLALEMTEHPLAVYDCSDAELDRVRLTFKMMKVAYLLLQRSAKVA